MPPSGRVLRGQGPKIAVAVVGASLLTVGLALVERHLTERAQIERLERVSSSSTAADRAASDAIAAQERVIIARLGRTGATIFRTGPVPVGRGAPGQMLDATDAQLPAWPAREEVRAALAGTRTFGRYWVADGSVLVRTLAQPAPEGGVLYILRGSRIRHPPATTALLTLLVGSGISGIGLLLAAIERRRRRGDDLAA